MEIFKKFSLYIFDKWLEIIISGGTTAGAYESIKRGMPDMNVFYIFLICWGIGLVTLMTLSFRKSKFSKLQPKITLKFYGDHKHATKVDGSDQNIFNWHCANNLFKTSNQMGVIQTITIINIFITFDKPADVKQIILKSTDFPVPQYEVKELNHRYAIIGFEGKLPEGELHIISQ